jgi:hypothetical protein
LVGGLQSDSIVLKEDAPRMFPDVRLVPYREAVQEALDDLVPVRLERVWEGMTREAATIKHEGFFLDYRRLKVSASAEAVYRVFADMGGAHGWPYANWLWRLRGWLDRLVSRPNTRTDIKASKKDGISLEPDGQGDPLLKAGDRIDYYRVEAVERGCMLRLHSELRAPGEGWMEWRLDEQSDQSTLVTQTAFFAPRGLPGFLYWFMLGPLHRLVFRGLIRAIRQRSEQSRRSR